MNIFKCITLIVAVKLIKYFILEYFSQHPEPKTRHKKRVLYYSNNQLILSKTDLTLYYSDLLNIPLDAHSINSDLVHQCYVLKKIEVDSSAFIKNEEDCEAAANFLTDRILFVSSMN